MDNYHKCIFCLEESTNFNTVEHIIPESLGNTDDILFNAVCDKCQNYLGKEIEKFVLSNSQFAFWRTMYGIPSKHGKAPFYDISLDNKISGKISNFHELSDRNVILHPTHANYENIVEVEIEEEDLLKKILSGEKSSFNVVMTPKILIYTGRFLGKIVLEYIYFFNGSKAFESKYDELRRYVRYGTTNCIWPIFRCNLRESLLSRVKENNDNQSKGLYCCSYYIIEPMGTEVFVMDIGSERYSMIINEKYPDMSKVSEELNSILTKGAIGQPNVLYYPVCK